MASRAMTPATTGPGALFRVRQSFPRPRVDDVATAVREQLRRPEVAATLASRPTVALAVGSRGIAAIAAVVTATVAELQHQGCEVFVVPSMGSHGGATADGQVEVLAHLGITAEGIGAPIRSSMDVVEVATVVSAHGNPVHLVMDAIAWNDADTVIPVNRIKPHTGFKGPVESGICKMLAIGLGKHEGARRLHGGGAGAERDDADEQDEHGGDPAGDRVEERQVGTAVRRGEQREVHELERRGHRDERPHAGVDVAPGQRSHRCEDQHRGRHRDRRRRLRVALAGQEQVPERVQERGPERESEGRSRHRGGTLRPDAEARYLRPRSGRL